jgi:hypothetical protein
MACGICDCCEAFVEVGCFEPCSALVLATNAPTSGTYKLKVSYMGNAIEISAAQVSGQPLTFPLEGLNEHYNFKGKVYNAAGDAVVLEGSTTCLAFATTPTIQIL